MNPGYCMQRTSVIACNEHALSRTMSAPCCRDKRALPRQKPPLLLVISSDPHRLWRCLGDKHGGWLMAYCLWFSVTRCVTSVIWRASGVYASWERRRLKGMRPFHLWVYELRQNALRPNLPGYCPLAVSDTVSISWRPSLREGCRHTVGNGVPQVGRRASGHSTSSLDDSSAPNPLWCGGVGHKLKSFVRKNQI